MDEVGGVAMSGVHGGKKPVSKEMVL